MKTKTILIFGLPGSGKTYISKCLLEHLDADHFNADAIRAQHDDWDFSEEGRLCLLYTSPSPRDGLLSRMPSSA